MKGAEKLENMLCKVAGSEHIVDPRMELQYSNAKGEGYLGEVKSIKLIGKNKDLNVIVKSASSKEKFREQAPIKEVFQTEVWFYDQFKPAFIKFQLDQGVKNPFVNFPKCYATQLGDMEEALLLEDLKDLGFVSWNRQMPMNREHLQFVLKEYGRFHAINFAMKNLEPETYKRLISEVADVMGLLYSKCNIGKSLTDLTKSLETIFDPETERDMYDAHCSFAESAGKLFLEYIDQDNYDISIILHGDCWSNNMMFKYEDPNNNKEPLTMKLIDFQLTREGPPVLDLTYFFYVCAADESLNDLDKYLSIYHQSLKDTLAEFDLDVDEIYPFKKLMEHWKKYAKYGLSMAYFLIRAMLSDSDEVPDLSEMAESGGDISDCFDYKGRSDGEYRRRIKVLFTHLYENGFI